MIEIVLFIAFSIIALGFLFIYLKLKEIEITLESLNEDLLINLRTLAKTPEEIVSKVNRLLKKEIIIKNVLKVP